MKNQFPFRFLAARPVGVYLNRKCVTREVVFVTWPVRIGCVLVVFPDWMAGGALRRGLYVGVVSLLRVRPQTHRPSTNRRTYSIRADLTTQVRQPDQMFSCRNDTALRNSPAASGGRPHVPQVEGRGGPIWRPVSFPVGMCVPLIAACMWCRIFWFSLFLSFNQPVCTHRGVNSHKKRHVSSRVLTVLRYVFFG